MRERDYDAISGQEVANAGTGTGNMTGTGAERVMRTVARGYRCIRVYADERCRRVVGCFRLCWRVVGARRWCCPCFAIVFALFATERQRA